MKKLAYFLILFVGMNVYASDRVGSGGGNSSSSGGSSSCRRGDMYLQMVHWRNFVGHYAGRCATDRKAEAGRYIDSMRNYMEVKSFDSQDAEKVITSRGGRVSAETCSGPDCSHGGSGYGSNSASLCATDLTNAYESALNSQGSSYCSSQRARFDEILSTTGLENIKRKALAATCSGANAFPAGACSPQTGSIAATTQSTANTSSVSAGGGGGSEETMAVRATPAVQQTANASAESTNLQRTVRNSSGIATPGADAEAPPAGERQSVTVPATPPPQAAAKPAEAKPEATAAPQAQSKSDKTARAGKATGGGNVGGVASTGEASNGSAPSGSTPVVQASSVSPSASGKGETATGGKDSSKAQTSKKIEPITFKVSEKEKKEYKPLFVGARSCVEPSTSPSDDTRRRLAQMDVMINTYKNSCVDKTDSVRVKWHEGYKGVSNKMRAQYNINNRMQETYVTQEKELSSENKNSAYCTNPVRNNFYRTFTEFPHQGKMEDFSSSMCN